MAPLGREKKTRGEPKPVRENPAPENKKQARANDSKTVFPRLFYRHSLDGGVLNPRLFFGIIIPQGGSFVKGFPYSRNGFGALDGQINCQLWGLGLVPAHLCAR